MPPRRTPSSPQRAPAIASATTPRPTARPLKAAPLRPLASPDSCGRFNTRRRRFANVCVRARLTRGAQPGSVPSGDAPAARKYVLNRIKDESLADLLRRSTSSHPAATRLACRRSRPRRRRGRCCAAARPRRPSTWRASAVPRSCQVSSAHCARPVAPSGWPLEIRPPDGFDDPLAAVGRGARRRRACRPRPRRRGRAPRR